MEVLANFDIHDLAYFGVGCYFLKISLPWLMKATKVYWDTRSVPGPLCVPFFGSVGFIFDILSRTVSSKSVEGLLKKYGGFFRVVIGDKLFLVISNPSDIKDLAESKNVSLESPLFSRSIGNKYNSESAYNNHLYEKKISVKISSTFNKSGYANRNIFDKNCKVLINNMNKLCNKDLISISKTIDRCVADVLTDIIFGTEFSFQNGSHDAIIDSCKKLPQAIYERGNRFWLHNDHLYSQTNLRMKELEFKEVISVFVTKMIDKRINHFNGGAIDDSNCLTDTLLKHYKRTENGTSVVVHETMFSFYTGMFMICDTMNFLILMLAMNESSHNKVFEEIKNFYTDERNGYLHLENFQYLRSCLREVLRLFPQLSISSRYAINDIKMNSRNVTIPADSEILISNFTANRNPNLWNMPDQFIPERYENENFSIQSNKIFNFDVFPENQFEDLGERIILTLTINLLKEFKFKNDWKIEKLPLETRMITKCDWGYKAKVSRRN